MTNVKLDYVMDELLEARKQWDTQRFKALALTDTIPLENATEEDVDHAWRILNIERSILDSQDIFFVEPDMHRLILAAMETFEPEPLLSTDLIAPIGYVRLPEPIDIPGVDEKVPGFKPINAEGEGSYLPKHSAFGWRQGQLEDPESDKELGLGILLTYFHTGNDLEVGMGVGLYPGRYIGWPLKDTVSEPDKMHVGWHPAYLYPRVFFRLVMQRLTEVAVMSSPPRQVRRRHERAGYTLPRYSVVRLRRHSRPSTTDEEAERKWKLNYRTVTRGHWRQQWYPSIQAHRQIWIDEFIRGPEDAELVIRPRIFDVRD